MRQSIYFLFTLVLLLGLTQCQKIEDLENATFQSGDVEVAVPLLNTSISLEDLFKNLDDDTYFLSTDSTGALQINYKGNKFHQDITTIKGNILEVFAPEYAITSQESSIPLLIAGVDIQKMTFKKGMLMLKYASNITEDIELTVEIPGLEKDGLGYLRTQNVVYNGTLPSTGSFIIENLAGYTATAEDGALQIHYKAMKGDGTEVDLDQLSLIFSDLDFSYFEGKFDEHYYNENADTINLWIFRDNLQGQIYFENPSISVEIENSFGIPTYSIINAFNFKDKNGQTIQLENDIINNGIAFEYPSLSEVGQSKTTKIAFTRDNSNINDIIAAGPVSLEYDVDAKVGGDMNAPSDFFVTDSSSYNAQVHVKLPLHGTANGFSISNISEFDGSEWNKVSHLELKLVTENELPIDVKIQVEFLDKEGNILTTLFDDAQNIINAASVDASGNVTEPNTSSAIIPIEESRIEDIIQAKQIRTIASLSTLNEGQTNVKVFANQSVKIKLGVKAKKTEG